MSDVRRALAERDAKLPAYHLVASTEQGADRAQHEFFFRAPSSSRGVVLAPVRAALAFDGQRFYRLLHEAKRLDVYDVKLSPPRAAYFLASTFTPFVPEGFRAPLLPSTGVSVRRISHPRADRAVALTATVEGLEHTWVLRWPSADVLSKRVGDVELTVEREHCEPERNLCVPTRVVQRGRDGGVEASTTVTQVDLRPTLANDGFRLTAPEGYATEQRALTDETPEL